MAKIIKLKDLLFEQPPRPGQQPPKKSPPAAGGGGEEETEKKLKINIPDTPFNPDAEQITSELLRILQSWEINQYPNDRVRWNDYYHDIETLVKKIKGASSDEV